MLFSLDHKSNFGGKPKICEIHESVRENPDKFGRVRFK